MANDMVLWLTDEQAMESRLVGPKAARLAEMSQAGLPVPPAFIVTTDAFDAGMTSTLEKAILSAYDALLSHNEKTLVAVRSSAVAEDLAGASFAGMQSTVLSVAGAESLLAAVRQVWASLDSEQARAYRQHAGLRDSQMAVLVQRQVPARAAGVAFGRDPITGEVATVVEAIEGLGEALAQGEAEPQRWRVEQTSDARCIHGPSDSLLSTRQLEEVVALVEQTERMFGEPQDIEWATDGDRVWLLQSRSITGRKEDWFTDHLPGDRELWTAAFLNERFTQPVSPLGWTLVAKPLERLALRGSLELLGAASPDWPLLKLWRGHPYSRVEAWQKIYKLFPDVLLPEDAERYFPEGDISLRRAPRYPVIGPHLLRNGLRVLLKHWQSASPLHNPRGWARHEARQVAALLRFQFDERRLMESAAPIAPARRLLGEVAALTVDLLELHRWSLLYADLFYSLLRRLLGARYGASEGAARAVQLTADVQSPTTRMNDELARLAARVAAEPDVAEFLRRAAEATPAGKECRLSEITRMIGAAPSASFQSEMESFLQRYGHRFFSLDFYDAPWEADFSAFARLLLTLSHSPFTLGMTGERFTPPPFGKRIVRLTREYLRLREAQRFHWQQLMALQRRVALHMGQWWSDQGDLAQPEDVFGLTWDELMADRPDRDLAARRMARLRRLRDQAAQAPGWHYPDFLRGNHPIRLGASGVELHGRPVSPGIARGIARLVAHPGDFDRLRPGDILVTSSPDPGWTPIFGTVSGMITERGGQLSHGAVVAREYGLPAVSGIPGLFGLIREGETLLVDGTQGIVLRESASENGHED